MSAGCVLVDVVLQPFHQQGLAAMKSVSALYFGELVCMMFSSTPKEPHLEYEATFEKLVKR